MQYIFRGYRGFKLLFNLNWDRLVYLATITLALLLGAFIGSL